METPVTRNARRKVTAVAEYTGLLPSKNHSSFKSQVRHHGLRRRRLQGDYVEDPWQTGNPDVAEAAPTSDMSGESFTPENTELPPQSISDTNDDGDDEYEHEPSDASGTDDSADDDNGVDAEDRHEVPPESDSSLAPPNAATVEPTSFRDSSTFGSDLSATGVPSSQCQTIPCRTFRALASPYTVIVGVLAVILVYWRRRSRRPPSQGAYRAVAARYVSSAFDEELSPDDYLSDDEADEFWTHGKKTIEMGTFQDDLTLDEING